MASTTPTGARPPALTSHETALCIVPPAQHRRRVDALRAHYDRAHGQWPAHVNVLYPFVEPAQLPAAEVIVRDVAASVAAGAVALRRAGTFENRGGDTVYLAPGDDGGEGEGEVSLRKLRRVLEDAFAVRASTLRYNPHLTLGQMPPGDAMTEHVEAKATLLLPVEFEVAELCILVREREGHASYMRLWKSIPLGGSVAGALEASTLEMPRLSDLSLGESNEQGHRDCYCFDDERRVWTPVTGDASDSYRSLEISEFSVGTYNVLAEFTCPPSRDRYPALLQAILSSNTLCDVLALQEVTDDFLMFLLRNESVQTQWPFVTHGSPEQADTGPLPSLCNIVVLSRFPFTWRLVPFQKKHKNAAVLSIDAVRSGRAGGAGETEASQGASLPIVVACVHLTPGLTAGSVAAKRSQIQTLLSFLKQHYHHNPWVIVGDFNIMTSSATIKAAIETKEITPDTAKAMRSLEYILSEENLNDAWYSTRPLSMTDQSGVMKGDWTLHEGEEGATFDPLTNKIALETVETVGSSWNTRPQRYDRILYKSDGSLYATDFGFFGYPKQVGGASEASENSSCAACGSDHWGLRTAFALGKDETLDVNGSKNPDQENLTMSKAVDPLQNTFALETFLEAHGQVPRQEDYERREKAMEVLSIALTGRSNNVHGSESSIVSGSQVSSAVAQGVRLILVTVGSYRLGVWSAISDIDCLCIGPISTKTFFALAKQRLRRAAKEDIKIIRTVKALSGTMLILKVRDVRIDLHYSPAAQVTETWPKAVTAPTSDPMFDLPLLSLRKLKSFRDDYFVLQTIPNLACFRTAHRLIKLWATSRGIYAARFGYLGGIHITLLLANICKRLYGHAGSATPSDVVRTFFRHYARFDWARDIVFDPFFHRGSPRYQRTAREPMVILAPHRPVTNVARATSPPSVVTLARELQRGDLVLSNSDATWAKLIGRGAETGAAGSLINSGAQDFLSFYQSFVRIDASYWGSSRARAGSLLAWIESRCVVLLVELSQKLPQIHARIWPTRFTGSMIADDSSGLETCYLIGLEKASANAGTKVQETDRKVLQETLAASLRKFSDQLKGNETAFDPATCYISVAQVSQSNVNSLTTDEREWEDGGGYEDASDSDEEDEEDELDDESALDEGKDNSDSLFGGASTSRFGKTGLQGGKGASNTEGQSTPKLRPAIDVLNRLRWDSSLDSDDFVIGYEDRFYGIKELALRLWKSEQTDEEFIPQHRILYFKRISDSVRVWDRRERLDLVFGTGKPS